MQNICRVTKGLILNPRLQSTCGQSNHAAWGERGEITWVESSRTNGHLVISVPGVPTNLLHCLQCFCYLENGCEAGQSEHPALGFGKVSVFWWCINAVLVEAISPSPCYQSWFSTLLPSCSLWCVSQRWKLEVFERLRSDWSVLLPAEAQGKDILFIHIYSAGSFMGLHLLSLSLTGLPQFIPVVLLTGVCFCSPLINH